MEVAKICSWLPSNSQPRCVTKQSKISFFLLKCLVSSHWERWDCIPKGRRSWGKGPVTLSGASLGPHYPVLSQPWGSTLALPFPARTGWWSQRVGTRKGLGTRTSGVSSQIYTLADLVIYGNCGRWEEVEYGDSPSLGKSDILALISAVCQLCVTGKFNFSNFSRHREEGETMHAQLDSKVVV